jgi:hypothetical protein
MPRNSRGLYQRVYADLFAAASNLPALLEGTNDGLSGRLLLIDEREPVQYWAVTAKHIPTVDVGALDFDVASGPDSERVLVDVSPRSAVTRRRHTFVLVKLN